MKQGDVRTQDEAVVTPVPHVGTFTRVISLAAGTQSITGIGFRPSAVVFFGVIPSTGAVAFGVSNSSNSEGILNKHEETADQWTSFGTSCLGFLSGVSDQYQGNVSSMDVDGFTVNWIIGGGSPVGTAQMKFLAFK